MKYKDGFAPIALIVVLVIVISAAAGTFVYFHPGDEVKAPAQETGAEQLPSASEERIKTSPPVMQEKKSDPWMIICKEKKVSLHPMSCDSN